MAQFDLINSNQQTNILRRIRTIQLAIAMSIGVLGLVILLVVLILVDRRMHADIVRIEETLVQIEAQMVALEGPLPEVQPLTNEITRVNGLRVAVENIALPPNIDWPSVINTIRNYDAQLIDLATLAQTEDRITLEGRSASNLVVVGYAQQLAQSPLFSRVDVQSIRNIRTTAHRPDAFVRVRELSNLILAPDIQPEDEQDVQFVLILVLNLTLPNSTLPNSTSPNLTSP